MEEKNEDEINLLDLFATLIRHKKLIIRSCAGTAIFFVLFAIVSLLLPPKVSYLPNLYTPKATMLINDADSGGLSSMLAGSGMSGLASMAGISAGGSSYGLLAQYLATSSSFLDPIIERFHLVERYKVRKSVKAESRKALQKQLSGAFDEDTGIFTLSFTDYDPDFARDVVNYAVELLDARFQTIGLSRNSKKKDQLEAKVVDVKVGIGELEDKIQAFQRKYGVISVESLATEQITTLAKVRSEVMMKEIEIKTYGQLSRVDDPMLRKLQMERNNLQSLLSELESGDGRGAGELPSQKAIPAIALEYAHIKRDLLVQEAVYQLLVSQYEAAKLAASGEDPAFQVLELAESPDKKSGPSRGMICVIAIFAALFLSCLAAFALESIQKLKQDPEALASLKGN